MLRIHEEERQARVSAQQELIEEYSTREDFMQELHAQVQALHAQVSSSSSTGITSQVRVALQDVSTDIEGLRLCPYASH